MNDSVFSDLLTTTSQSSVPEPAGVIEQLLDLLVKDQELRRLFERALPTIPNERFQRNFSRILKIYASDLRFDAETKSQQEAGLFVKYRRHTLAARVCSIFSGNSKVMDAAQLEALASAKQELPGYLEHHTAPQMVSPIELQDGSDSSDSDEGDSACPRLDQIRRFLVGGPAFTKLHENLASFVDPLQIDAADDVEKYPKGEEISRVPHATSADEPRNHDRYSSLIFNKRYFAMNLVHSLAYCASSGAHPLEGALAISPYRKQPKAIGEWSGVA